MTNWTVHQIHCYYRPHKVRRLKGRCNRTSGPKGALIKVSANHAEGSGLSTLAPGVHQGSILQDVTGVILWDSLIALRNKAKQTDRNMRINFPILLLTLPTKIWFLSLAAAPRLAWVWITIHLANITSQDLGSVRWYHSYLRFSHGEGIPRFFQVIGNSEALRGFYSPGAWTLTGLLW